MKILFLIVFFSVVHASWTPVNFDKNISKYFGVWYVNAWTGNVDIPEDKRHQKIPPFIVRALPNGKLEARLTLKKNGRCEEIKLTLEKTKEPGKMTTWGRQIVGILSLRIEDQIIVYIESKMNGKNVIMMELAGRNVAAHPEAMKVFKQFVRSKGQDETKIIVPELEGNKDGFSNFS
ncbi:major allergen Can f 1-like [Trichosurus vulpecula]|uniref:major allergen Can f 1-like n=1 Tax=Trichosurus vulpecula TaxID=9337 RepID=UPI00186B29CA|nr:major allergen Can f 1-like [Trichosurus vulpecula]